MLLSQKLALKFRSVSLNFQCTSKADKWEDISMICPHHCVCQYAHRMDLSISRWVHEVETRQKKGHEFVDSDEEAANNEVINFCLFLLISMPKINYSQIPYDDDISPQNNELLKFTMCLLPSNIEPKDLIASLPHDVEALVLLSTENRQNLSGGN